MSNTTLVMQRDGWNTYAAKSLRSSFLYLYYARDIANVRLKLQKPVPYLSENAKKFHVLNHAIDLPSDVTSSPSLFTFKRRLKMHLFRLSYPDLTF